ncbi:EMG1 nucleolar protein [Perkinsela sp. CCAP 1560/4]|nr:EMG1 nucleolar protein [Perkinsela sp. CCAP 1560/4]|eukprot:KNH07737.1 EMG1 nucleolar protein [Perkinsela sp. CCAP 1560/4]
MSQSRSSVRIPTRAQEAESWNRVVVVLDACVIELFKGKQTLKRRMREKSNSFGNDSLIDGELHKGYISKVLGEDPAKYRLDIVHHCLLQLLDSPLCLAGHLEVYLKLDCGTLVHVDPRFECPLIFDEFKVILTELLVFRRVKASEHKHSNSNQKRSPLSLLRIVKNPLADHLPTSQQKAINVFSVGDTAEFVALHDLIAPTIKEQLSKDGKISVKTRELSMSPVFVIGAFKQNSIDISYWKSMSANYGAIMREVKISERELSGGVCCAMLTHEYESKLRL